LSCTINEDSVDLLDLMHGFSHSKDVEFTAWRRVGKAEVEVEVDADMVEEKLEEEEDNSSDKI